MLLNCTKIHAHHLLQSNPKGQSKRDNPEKLVTSGTQDEEKQYALDITICKQTQINENKTCTLLLMVYFVGNLYILHHFKIENEKKLKPFTHYEKNIKILRKHLQCFEKFPSYFT